MTDLNREEFAEVREALENKRWRCVDYNAVFWMEASERLLTARDALAARVRELENPQWPEVVKHLMALANSDEGLALIRWYEVNEERWRGITADRERLASANERLKRARNHALVWIASDGGAEKYQEFVRWAESQGCDGMRGEETPR